MKFYEGNKKSGEFELPDSEVAGLFITAMKRAGNNRLYPPSADQLAKLNNWPLERTLRDWLTRIDGFNASWDDEAGFERILDGVREWFVKDLHG